MAFFLISLRQLTPSRTGWLEDKYLMLLTPSHVMSYLVVPGLLQPEKDTNKAGHLLGVLVGTQGNLGYDYAKSV